METNYEQLIPPPITESELVPVEVLGQKRKDTISLTLER